eukprot:TRINITY_DN2453_c0_g1_i9.p1 TRINITY_DN2453_c0_g1~~TRINITY_DN2453_c0_g1_i9.p1  ORF type:complete len:709 (-),score=158.27 TRINITY_DN2453_c0_g1_i9:13-2043(-)
MPSSPCILSERLQIQDDKRKRAPSRVLRSISPSKHFFKAVRRTMTSLGDPPISKTISDRARSEPFVKKFNLPPDEILIHDFSAALNRQILLHGRLYISQNFVCFESRIFGTKTSEVIALKDITEISKKSKRVKLTHGIEISTSTQNWRFASFVSREKAFTALCEAWFRAVPEQQHLHRDSTESGSDSDDDSEYANTNDDFISDSGALSDSRAFEDTSLTEDEARSSTMSMSTIHSSVDSGPNLGTNAPTSHVYITQNGDIIRTDTTSPKEPEIHPQPQDIASTSSTTVISTTTTAISDNQAEEIFNFDEEEETDQGFLGGAQFQTIIDNAVLEVSAVNFFKAFLADSSTFTHRYHTQRGDQELVIKKWARSPQFGTIRDITYSAKVNAPIGPDRTRVQETQRYRLKKNKLVVETVGIMFDIPYGDFFRVEGRWEITSTGPDTTKLHLTLGVNFTKKTWFKGKIEAGVMKESGESYQRWLALARAELKKPEVIEKLKPALPQANAIRLAPVSSMPRNLSKDALPPMAEQLPGHSMRRIPSGNALAGIGSPAKPKTKKKSVAGLELQHQASPSIPPLNPPRARTASIGSINIPGSSSSLDSPTSSLSTSPLPISSPPAPSRISLAKSLAGGIEISGYTLLSVNVILVAMCIYLYIRLGYIEGKADALEKLLHATLKRE